MKPLIVANWKCNPVSFEEASLLVEKIESEAEGQSIVICPPSIFLSSLIEESGLSFGAQNCFSEAKGAFTGELSVPMLEDAGVEYVIIGHSERRKIFKETDEEINRKLLAVLPSSLIPILCFGESREEREEGRAFEVISDQLTKCLADVPVEKAGKIILAYEPVWAIGTGKPAEPVEIKEVRAFVEQFLSSRFETKIRILYGGSVDSKNASLFTKEAGMDGLLVGGASLKADEFLGIIKAA